MRAGLETLVYYVAADGRDTEHIAAEPWLKLNNVKDD
jgi:hypothetical protein